MGAVRLRARVGRARRAALAILALAAGRGQRPQAAAAAPSATFAPPTGSFEFGTSITFSDTITLAGAPKRVELLLSQPGSIGPDPRSRSPTRAPASTRSAT